MDFIAKPFGWLLMFLYDLTKNYGIAIFLFAFVVKVVLLYFSAKSKKSMMRSSRFTPYLKELEAKYEGNKQKYQEEVAKLYKEEHISPMGGCLWSLIPFPILLALYRAIRFPITIMMGVSAEAYELMRNVLNAMGYVNPAGARNAAYAQIYESQFITEHFEKFSGLSDKLQPMDYHFLGLDLGAQPSWRFWEFGADGAAIWPALGLFLIPIASALLGWLQTKISMKTTPAADPAGAAANNKTMMLMMPLMSLWIGFAMPGALGLYWIATSVFQTIQDAILNKIFGKQLDAEDAERNTRLKARAEEIERKRQETERLHAEGATAVNPNTSKRKMQKTERQKAEQKAAEWQAQNKPKKQKAEAEPSRVGDRPYARGRAYTPDRFDPRYQVPVSDDEEALLPDSGEAADGQSTGDMLPEIGDTFDVTASEITDPEADDSTRDGE